MLKIILELNLNKDCVCDFAKQIIEYLNKRDCEVFFFGDLKDNLAKKQKVKEADFVFSIGGDGTLLSTARKYAKYKKKILGINLGYLGYLKISVIPWITFAKRNKKTGLYERESNLHNDC